jgi:outer membrane receptor protein involved in Fe transport
LFVALSALGTQAFAQTAGETAPAAETKSGDEDIVVLSEFSVSTEKDSGYRATNSIAATRTNTPIKDVPMNIQVFTKDLYEDLNITNQIELERYNASMVNGGADVRSSNPIQQAYNQFLFRGFVQNWGLRDGIRQYDPIDTQGLARVEVVKGPAAALYGLSYPGGVMNNITKEVDFGSNFTGLDFMIASEGEYRAAVDTNVSGDTKLGKVGARFNGAYTQTADERAHSEGSIQYVQLNLEWRPYDGTQLQFLWEDAYREKPNGLSYFTRGETNAQGQGLGNGASIPLQAVHTDIPWTWNWADGRNMRSLRTELYRGTIIQRVNENFSLIGYVQYSSREQRDGDGWDANGSGGGDSWEAGGGWITQVDGRDVTGTSFEHIRKGYSYRDWSNNMHAYGATGVYKFNFGEVKNTFTFGGAAWAEKFVSRSSTQPQDATQQVLIYPVEAGIDTTTTPFAPPTDLSPNTTGNGWTHENNSNDYYYVAWNMSALDNRLKLNAAVNKTNLKLVQWANGQATTYNLTEESEVSPMIGGMFDITKNVSVFAVHATSLFPTTDKNSFGEQMPPVTGASLEGGFKLELMEGKISGTISYFQISQEGGAVNDPTAENLNTQRWDSMTPAQRAVAFPGQTRSDLLGDLVPNTNEVTSDGLEFDLILQPTRSWQILLSYATIDKDQFTSGLIKDQISALTKYSFLEGGAKGLMLGLGYQHSGEAVQDQINGVTRYNPASDWAEVFAGYGWSIGEYKAHVQLNLKNLTQQDEYFGWQPTGSASVVATQRYRISTPMVYQLSFGLDF